MATENRLFTESEVNEIIRKRLARVRAAQQPLSYTVTRLPWAKAEEKRSEQPREENDMDIIAQARQILLYVPRANRAKWLKGAREALCDLTEKLEELRASGAEKRAINEIESISEELRVKIVEVEALRNADLKEVEPEVRATKEQEEDIITQYAFLPDAEREAIRTKVLKSHLDKKDPSAVILRKYFERPTI